MNTNRITKWVQGDLNFTIGLFFQNPSCVKISHAYFAAMFFLRGVGGEGDLAGIAIVTEGHLNIRIEIPVFQRPV